MIRSKSARIKKELKKAFDEDHTAHEVALSFSIGVFITSLPTLGAGLLVFALLAHFFSRISKVALLASVLILNPFIKPFFYVTSIVLGRYLLELTSYGQGLEPPTDVIVFLITGNLIIAFLLAIIGYFLALKLFEKFEEDKENIIRDIEEVTSLEDMKKD